MSDLKRVAALWAMILAAFALFNAIYWPVHRRQADLDPVNFMRYADKLHANNELAAAIDVIKKGIAANRPPDAKPYSVLQNFLVERKDLSGAEALTPTIAFYRAIGPGMGDRKANVMAAARLQLARTSLPTFSDETALALQACAQGLSTALHVPDLADALDPAEDFALLAVAGGRFMTGGAIGSTGATLPYDLIVQSGGGAKERRLAHIFVRDHDYGGNERGFHVALLEPTTGETLQLGVFDIWSSGEDNDRMVRLLNGAPPGTIGAFAVLDDASANFDDDLEAALRTFGFLPEAMLQRHPRFFGLRYSFAAIGVKGAIPGTALQTWSPDEYEGRLGHPVACMVLADNAPTETKP